MYCGNDCSGNPFCGEASKKIGAKSVFAAQKNILKIEYRQKHNNAVYSSKK
jgi:hypothetical protein